LPLDRQRDQLFAGGYLLGNLGVGSLGLALTRAFALRVPHGGHPAFRLSVRPPAALGRPADGGRSAHPLPPTCPCGLTAYRCGRPSKGRHGPFPLPRLLGPLDLRDPYAVGSTGPELWSRPTRLGPASLRHQAPPAQKLGSVRDRVTPTPPAPPCPPIGASGSARAVRLHNALLSRISLTTRSGPFARDLARTHGS
jgi:hypothetical protein